MEFEELQKIWDTQNDQPLYAINEKALFNRIASKKKQVIHIAHVTEWLLIIVNIAAGSFILGANYLKHGWIFIYILSAWMFASALYVLIHRIRRIISQPRFNHSMLDDLQHGIAAANYQVRLSRIMRWNILPIGLLTLLSILESGKPVWMVLVTSLFFILVFYASGWEHNIYKAKKQELERLQKKLQMLQDL